MKETFIVKYRNHKLATLIICLSSIIGCAVILTLRVLFFADYTNITLLMFLGTSTFAGIGFLLTKRLKISIYQIDVDNKILNIYKTNINENKGTYLWKGSLYQISAISVSDKNQVVKLKIKDNQNKIILNLYGQELNGKEDFIVILNLQSKMKQVLNITNQKGRLNIWTGERWYIPKI